MYEGQKEAEILFGPTMTRTAIKVGNNIAGLGIQMGDGWTSRGDAFKSGDVVKILETLGSIAVDPFAIGIIDSSFSGSSQASGWGLCF